MDLIQKEIPSHKQLRVTSRQYESTQTGRAVYQVQNSTTRMVYSLKRFDLTKNKLDSIQRELAALNQLPFGVAPKCHDFWQTKSAAYLLIDWIGGEPLSKIFKGIPKDEYELARRIKAFERVIFKAGQLHKYNRVHRDLKPDNILFQDTHNLNSCELIDFGLAITLRESVEGTIGYQAPEQHLLRQFNISPQTDIFSLGQILCQLTSGEVSSLQPNAQGTDWLHPPDPFYPACIQQATRLTQIIVKATAFRPNQRYTNVWQLHNDLKGIK